MSLDVYIPYIEKETVVSMSNLNDTIELITQKVS